MGNPFTPPIMGDLFRFIFYPQNPSSIHQHTGVPIMNKRLLRRPEVETNTGLSRSTLYRMIAAGTFPKPIVLAGRMVAWKESDIQQWIDDRIKASEQAA